MNPQIFKKAENSELCDVSDNTHRSSLSELGDSLTSAFAGHTEQSSSKPSDHNPALKKLAETRNLLMLQGPIGPLFDRIAHWKKSHGAQVHRIVFNAGDALFCRALKAKAYKGSVSDWPKYLRKLINEHEIDAVLLFGQYRKYHAAAALICWAMGITLLVMEEGYIRPGFVTLELDGVNANSSTLKKYHRDAGVLIETRGAPKKIDHQFLRMASYAIAYYAALTVYKKQFALYQHHRETSPMSYTVHWMKCLAITMTKSLSNRKFVQGLENAGPYFFIPLQLDTDTQVIQHSSFDSSISFLRTVIRSFAEDPPDNTRLVIKQHPLAKGEREVEKIAILYAKKLGIENKIAFLYEGHVPTLIKHARGVVTINSTVGLQAIFQAKPLKVLGRALYENVLVTDSKPLHQFWHSPMKPNEAAAKELHASVKILTQVPAEIYAPYSAPLLWTEKWSADADA